MVGVSLERERRRGMAGEGLEVPYGLAALGKQRQAAVPEVVEPDGGKAGSREERLEVSVDDVLCLDGAAVLCGEHEAVVLPSWACASSNWRFRCILRALTALWGTPTVRRLAFFGSENSSVPDFPRPVGRAVADGSPGACQRRGLYPTT